MCLCLRQIVNLYLCLGQIVTLYLCLRQIVNLYLCLGQIVTLYLFLGKIVYLYLCLGGQTCRDREIQTACGESQTFGGGECVLPSQQGKQLII